MYNSSDPYFHYCSADSFFKIVSNKTLWLSSLTASNDRFEGRWLSHVVDRVSRDQGLSQWDRESLVSTVRAAEERIDCLGFCMSSDGDMLSQWRGYADDGAGFSIGFSRGFVGSAYGPSPFGQHISLQQITYDANLQDQSVRAYFPKIMQLVSEGAFRTPTVGSLLTGPKTPAQFESEKAEYQAKNQELQTTIWSMMPLMYTLKNQAFREEMEVRLIGPVMKPLRNLDFFFRRGRLVPYFELSVGPWAADKIQKVILGPKNNNPIEVVEGFLARHGLSGVEVATSEASYR